MSLAAGAAAVLLGSSGSDALHHPRNDVPALSAPSARRPLEASAPGAGHVLRGCTGASDIRQRRGGGASGEGVLRAPDKERRPETGCRGGGGEDFIGGEEFAIDVRPLNPTPFALYPEPCTLNAECSPLIAKT